MAKCAAFCAAALPLKIAYIIVWVSLICAVMALATPVWFKFKYNDPQNQASGTQGLWTHCYWSNAYTCCSTVNAYFDDSNDNTPAWMQAVRVLMFASVASGIVTLVAMSIQSCGLTTSKGCGVFVIIVCFLTGGLLTTTLITYAVAIQDNNWSSEVNYSFSFFACLLASLGYLAAGVLAVMSVCCLCCASSVDVKS